MPAHPPTTLRARRRVNIPLLYILVTNSNALSTRDAMRAHFDSYYIRCCCVRIVYIVNELDR